MARAWRFALAGAALLVGSCVLAQPGHAADTPPLQPDCIAHAESVQVSSAAEAEARMLGTWIRCRQATRKFFAHEGDDIGFEFTADGRFYRIYPDDSGGLIRAEGLTQEGTWQIGDPYPAEFEQSAWNLHLLGSGQFSDVITFHDDPDAIGIPYAKFHYFRWTGDDPMPGIPAGITEGPCGHPVDRVAVESAADVERLLTGAWTVCEPIAGSDLVGPGVVGIEFGAEGSFWTLVRASDGSLVRDESQPATWEVYPFDEDTLAWSSSGPLVVIASDGSERYLDDPVILAKPPFVSLGSSGGGLLKVMPPVSEVPLPATGTGSSTTMVAIAGSLLFVGFGMLVPARLRRR